jgi:lipid II:glycine glycyltransferase (peptidoglycan interpeptide bridge formation enzyme)
VTRSGAVSDSAELVDNYWEHHRRSTSADRRVRRSADEHTWAWEAVEARVHDEPDEVVALLVELANAAPDDVSLAYLGAGPIENLLCSRGSAVVFDEVERWARRDENFRKALRCAWFDQTVPPDVSSRLRAFGPSY